MEAPQLLRISETETHAPNQSARREPRASISIQPTPIEFSLIVTPDKRWSSLVRHWRPGESSRCRLCPSGECVVRMDTCHLMIEREIPFESAATYSTSGDRRRAYPLTTSLGPLSPPGRP